ncbi:MAG: YfhO family protein [Thermoanaerobaculia bacterium]|nr:YfhO family protein [Thermoanaerobaculia bacterium]
MIHFDPRLLVSLAAVEALLAGLLLLAARGLGRRLPARVLGVVALAPWLLLAPWLFGERLLVPTAALAGAVPGSAPLEPPDPFDAALNDAVYQLLPWELEVRHALAGGRLPLWSDLLDGGSNLWANPQAQVLSPTAMLARAVEIQHSLLAALLLKLLVAAAGTWLLARAVGLRARGAWLAAASYAYGGALLGWASFPLSAGAAWAPWVVLATLAVARRPTVPRVATGALLTAALLLAGHPEVALAAVLLAGVSVLALRSRRVPLVRALASCAAAGLLGLMLAAPQWLPFLELARGSQRAHEHAARRVSLAEARLGEPASWFAGESGRFLRGPLHPAPHWPPVPAARLAPRTHWTYATTAYLGVVALAGLALAVARRLPRRFWPFVLFFVATLLALGDFLPFGWLVSRLPGLGLAEDSRFLPAGLLAAALVAGHGADALFGGLRRPRALLAVGLAALASLAAGPPRLVLAPWLLILLAAALAGRHRRAASAALAAALLLDLGSWGRAVLPRGEVRHFYPATAFVARLQEEVAAPGGPWRATGHDFLVYPSLLPVYGIAEIRPHNPLAPQELVEVLAAAFGFSPSTQRYFSPLGNLGHPLLDFLNVRAAVTNQFLPPLDGWTRVDRGEALPQLYELQRNPEALPRWFLPTAVESVPRAGIGAWIAGLDDGRRVALLAGETRGRGFAPRPGEPGGVTAEHARPGRLRLAVGGGGERLLATSIPGPAGWRAEAAGRRLETLTVNGAFLGVVVPAGVRAVELAFRPPGLLPGTALGAAAALVLAALGARAWRRRRREPR